MSINVQFPSQMDNRIVRKSSKNVPTVMNYKADGSNGGFPKDTVCHGESINEDHHIRESHVQQGLKTSLNPHGLSMDMFHRKRVLLASTKGDFSNLVLETKTPTCKATCKTTIIYKTNIMTPLLILSRREEINYSGGLVAGFG